MRPVCWAAFAVAVCLGLVPAKAEQDCRLQLAASLPIEAKYPSRIIIPAEVNGQPVRLIVDTGSGYSAVSQAAADRLGIKTEIISGMRPYLPYAGGEAKYYAKTKDFKLGAMTAPRALFFVMPSEMPEADGVIGADFLRHFDLDFDFDALKMNLFAPHRCPGNVVYWTDPAKAAVIPFHYAKSDPSGTVSMLDPHIRFTMLLDGHKIPAILDTGAPSSVINDVQAKVWFGLDENSPGMEVKDGALVRYRFKSLQLGDVTLDNPWIRIATVDPSGRGEHPLSADALFGLRDLRKFHLYIAYEESTLYVTTAGAH